MWGNTKNQNKGLNWTSKESRAKKGVNNVFLLGGFAN